MTKRRKAATTGRHPSYPNPIIAEALCELHFALADGAEWKPSLAGDLFKQVQDEFPEMEPGAEIGVHFELSQQGIRQSWLPPRQRMRFKHKDRPLFLQLGPNVFTVNVLSQYPGWDNMCKYVLDAWRQACTALKPANITRVGLRYINRVETEEGQTPGEWFKASDYVPKAVLKSRGRFLSRVESQIDLQNRIIVTFAQVKQEGDEGELAIVLDIDRIVEKELAADGSALQPELDRLHEDVWQVFESVQTDRLLRRLKGERQ